MLRVVLLALVLAFAGLTARLFLFPDTDSPTKADAVVVLAGARKPRLSKGLALMRRGVAPLLVISDAPARGWPEANRLCARRASFSFKVVCFKAQSYSTRGEAEEIARLSRRNGWRRVVIVTSRFHVTRARMLVDRCLKDPAKADLVAAHVPITEWPRDLVFEWGKYLYEATIRRSC